MNDSAREVLVTKERRDEERKNDGCGDGKNERVERHTSKVVEEKSWWFCGCERRLDVLMFGGVRG